MLGYPLFNRNLLNLKSLSERRNDLDKSVISDLNKKINPEVVRKFKPIAKCLITAKKKKASIILMIGGHVIRSGVQRFIIDLMKKGYVSCLAMNGSGVIHDFEFALIGATTESVARYIKEGQFGLWKETGKINDYINQGYKKGWGLGESVGREISEGDFPYKNISLLSCAYQMRIPVTVHVGIGYDIIHEFPNCNGAATGATSYQDFLYFAKVVENLENGVVMNFGSSVMAPEVFLKALSMARNVSQTEGRYIKHFVTLVCDLYKLPNNFKKEPSKNNASYYFRPWKTMLVRTVSDGGKSFYVRGKHSDTIPALWKAINKASLHE